jgi:hypothetical protein
VLLGTALVLAACMLGGTVGSSVATTVESMTTSAQAASADRIFVGTVTSVASRPKADAPKYFETVVTFRVEDTVAGSVPSPLAITLSGGEVGGIRQRVEEMPELRVGERYVVLLEADRTPRLTSPFVGFNQGLYRVVGADPATAVVRDRSGRSLAADALPAGARGAPPSDPSLGSFLDGLRAARTR